MIDGIHAKLKAELELENQTLAEYKEKLDNTENEHDKNTISNKIHKTKQAISQKEMFIRSIESNKTQQETNVDENQKKIDDLNNSKIDEKTSKIAQRVQEHIDAKNEALDKNDKTLAYVKQLKGHINTLDARIKDMKDNYKEDGLVLLDSLWIIKYLAGKIEKGDKEDEEEICILKELLKKYHLK